jgi:hypothetical protein
VFNIFLVCLLKEGKPENHGQPHENHEATSVSEIEHPWNTGKLGSLIASSWPFQLYWSFRYLKSNDVSGFEIDKSLI